MNINISRPSHKLQHNHGNETPTHIAFIDTETHILNEGDSQKHYFKLGCLIYYRLRNGKYKEENRFYSTNREEFVNKIFSLCYTKSNLHIIAHNMHFDFAVCGFMREILSRKMKILKAIIDSNRFILKVRDKNKTYTFWDSGNIIKYPLSDLGKAIGLSKLQVDFNKCSIDELKDYCFRDVEILAKFMISYFNFIKEENLGNFAFTLASQAFNAFRHRFMTQDIFIHNNKEVCLMELESYRGGLCDLFIKGKVKDTTIYKLDVNSMYPFVMRNYEYPTRLVKFMRCITVENLEYMLNKYLAIIDLEFTLKNTWIAMHYNNRLCRVRGKIKGIITSAEYQFYKPYMKDIKIKRVAFYEKAKIFEQYIDFFYNKRIEAKRSNDEFKSLMYKLFMNSLYGKFAQKVREMKINILEENEVNNTEITMYNPDGSKSTIIITSQLGIELDDYVLSYDSFPAIASFVTAYARIYLHTLINKAGEKNVYYVDTDSIICNEQGYINLKEYIDNYELGKLKLEDTANFAEFIAPKSYTLGEKRKEKGVRYDAIRLGNGKVKQYRFLKSRSLWRKGIIDYALVEYYERNSQDQYRKGIVDENGIVHPFELEG